MTFLELASSRYSVRRYRPDPVEQEKLDLILQAGRVAPTACNNQPQRVFVIQDETLRGKLAEASPCTFDAPVILVICYDTQREAKARMRPNYAFGEMDAAIVCTHMMLQAWELGIGSCWVGLFDEEKVAAAIDLPETLRVAALLPLGYAAEGVRPAHLHDEIRPLEETVQIR